MDRETRSFDARPVDAPAELTVVVAAGAGAGTSARVPHDRAMRIGADPHADLVVDDPTVSRSHLELRRAGHELVLADAGSKNGCFLGAARFTEITARAPITIRIGAVELRVVPVADAEVVRFGGLVARSRAMREAIALLRRVADADVHVLVHGETGTGKEVAARAIHDASLRAARPFVIVDLAAVTDALFESELFGHVRGAFTGAAADRRGAFEEAGDGTVFLDEIGELAPAAQPRLLRVIERGEWKAVGANAYQRGAARVIAATHRDLAAEVAAGRFRDDLFHRLSVVTVVMPALRERPEDIPILVEHFLASSRRPLVVPPETIAAMMTYEWPGNVRQLRNVLDRAAVVAVDGVATLDVLGLELAGLVGAVAPAGAVEPFKDAKLRLVDAWERDYVTRLLAAARGNVTAAARIAGLARVHLHRLIRKHEVATADDGA